MVPRSSAARQLVVPIFDSLMSLGDGGTASCKLGKAQVGSGVVGGGGGGKGGRCLTWVGSWLLVGAPAVQVRSTSCTQHAAPPLQSLVAIRALSSCVFKAVLRCL